MKKILLSAAGLLIGGLAMAQISTPPGGGNQKSVVRQYIGAVPYVEVVYNSPDVTGPNGQTRKGQIWGSLVPYGFIGLGFGLNSDVMPLSPNKNACFWGGWGGSSILIDQDAALSASFVMNKMHEGVMGDPRSMGLVQQVYENL